MMTKDEKKELFLLLLEYLFDDNTEMIKTDNCIGFYHYLLDCFEFEEEYNRDYEEPGFRDFVSIVIKLLYEFPIYFTDKTPTREVLKTTILEMDNSINPEKFNYLLKKTQELYVMFREEYLI